MTEKELKDLSKPHPYIEMFGPESVFKIPNWPPTKEEYIQAIQATTDPQKKKEIAMLSLLVGIRKS